MLKPIDKSHLAGTIGTAALFGTGAALLTRPLFKALYISASGNSMPTSLGNSISYVSAAFIFIFITLTFLKGEDMGDKIHH